MHRRLLFRAVLLGLALAVPAVCRAADEQTKTDKPSVILRVAALDDLRANLRYLAELVGQGERANQFDALIKSRLDGIDATKPIGAYGSVGRMGFDSQLVALVPVSDPKAFLGLLDSFNVKADKGDDGVYTVNLDQLPAPAYFRFANGYAYVTVRDKEMLDKGKLLAPEKVLPAGQVGLLSLAVNIDQIPDNLKDLALGNLDNQLADQKDKLIPKETEAEKKLRLATTDQIAAALKSVIREGGETTLRLDLDRKKADLSLSLSVAGKAGSPLAATIKNLGKTSSITAALIGPDSAFHSTVNVSVPEKLRALLVPALEEEEKKALQKEKDEGRRAAMVGLFQSLHPTLKSGELDMTADLRGPNADGRYTMIGGIKVQDGAAIDKALRKIVDQLPPKQRKIVTFDVEKAGAVAIHRVAPDKNDKNSERVFGDHPLYVALRDNELLFALGEKGLSTLKESLETTPKAAPIWAIQASMRRLTPLMEKENKAALEIAREVFAKDQEGDKLHLILEGGDTLKLRFAVKARLVAFFNKLQQAKKGEGK